jgi:hypothetical protein
MKYLKQSTHKEEKFILAHCSVGSSPTEGDPVALGLWQG